MPDIGRAISTIACRRFVTIAAGVWRLLLKVFILLDISRPETRAKSRWLGRGERRRCPLRVAARGRCANGRVELAADSPELRLELTLRRRSDAYDR